MILIKLQGAKQIFSIDKILHLQLSSRLLMMNVRDSCADLRKEDEVSATEIALLTYWPLLSL